MAFDIYGNDLTPGYCEAHPWVFEEYPCHRCAGDRQEVQHHREMMDEMAKEYHAESMRQLELKLKQGKE